MFLYLVDNQLITRLSLDLAQMVIAALNWQVLIKIYFLKLLYHILFTKIDEKPHSSEYTHNQYFIGLATQIY